MDEKNQNRAYQRISINALMLRLHDDFEVFLEIMVEKCIVGMFFKADVLLYHYLQQNAITISCHYNSLASYHEVNQAPALGPMMANLNLFDYEIFIRGGIHLPPCFVIPGSYHQHIFTDVLRFSVTHSLLKLMRMRIK